MALGVLWMLNIAIAAAAAALLLGLVVYGRNARDIRSSFTIGLLVFGLAFLAQNLLAVWVYLSMNDQGLGANVAMPLLVLNAASLAGFSALFFVTWR